MRRIWMICALLVVGSTGSFTYAQQADSDSVDRPRIGLVLGGGGAKGGAHIGVLKTLDELRVPVDCVVGTSMGALIGGIFASGTPADEIEQSVLGIDWSRTVGGAGQRDLMSIEDKLTQQNSADLLEFGIVDGRVKTPRGLVATQNIEDQIRTLVAGARFTQDFDDLPLPFRAIATDAVASEMVVLDSGDVANAMRASMAIPGVFSPVIMDDKVLIDGGFMRNIPVDVTRDLCADIVIVVWFHGVPFTKDSDLSPVSLSLRSLAVMINANQMTQVASLTPQDVNIAVDIGDIGTGQFNRIPEAMELGHQAAIAQRDSLLRYSLPEDEYLAWRRSVADPDTDTHQLAEVRIVGQDRVSPAFIRTQLEHAIPGATVTPKQLAADAERVFALGHFESVEYQLLGPADKRVLEIRPVEKSWGPNIFSFDYGLATTGDADIHAVIRADHNLSWVNSRGGRWHNALQVGRQSLVTTDFYQPLDTAQRFFIQPIALFEERLENFYVDEERIAEYTVGQLYGQIDLGVNFGNQAQLRVGLRSGWNEALLKTGPPGLPEADRQNDSSLQVQFAYDTRDVLRLPTSGSFLRFRYVQSEEWLGGEREFSLIEGLATQSFDFRGNSLTVIAGGGDVLSGNAPFSENIELGGIRSFPGLRPGELRGNEYWFAGTQYLWRLLDTDPVFGRAIYGGLRLQAGEMKDDFGLNEDGVLYGIAGSLTGRTTFGVFLVSLGWVDSYGFRLQFSLGRPVAEGSIFDHVQF